MLRLVNPRVSFYGLITLLSFRSLEEVHVTGSDVMWNRKHLEAVFANPSIKRFTAENFGNFGFEALIRSYHKSNLEWISFVNPHWREEPTWPFMAAGASS